ncbi:MAG: DDE-type integrase/transposase/recombinase [Proteobacteria bacterium]|nr:DDE-type integrase/transposase/recombinase [Pseudomonadota bacterium]
MGDTLLGEKGSVMMESVEEVKRKSKGKESRFGNRYGFELKLRCVKLRLEEGLPVSLLCKEAGVSKDAVYHWVKAYQERGEAGLRNQGVSVGSRRKLPDPVREKIVEIKKRELFFGVQRISHLLKRVFFLSASPETVRRTLQEESLIIPSKKKHLSNITRPRFFERSTPNQLWQGDIFTFRLGGRYAYLVGMVDDYSRYMVGLELYRSQTADQVIEVYRRAVGEYGVPKEVLTDRGRQYTNWRGTTRFERELGKDRVKHIKSQAHHPMTLGKIERFWKTVYEEFLVRAQFGSFEKAQERIRHWVRYYNHKRPHQGIGGLYPADRYFEIQGELRKVMERGIAENVLEMALRGKPREPFYMVGRMEGQSVVLRAEKGKVRLLVDDEGEGKTQELVYEVNRKEESEGSRERGERDGKERESGEGGEAGRREEAAEGIGAYGAGEVPDGVVSLDGAEEAGRGMSGDGGGVGSLEAVAGSGDGGNAIGVAAASAGGERGGLESPSCRIIGEERPGGNDEGIGKKIEKAARKPEGSPGSAGGWVGEKDLTIKENPDGEGEKACAGSGGHYPAGAQWGLDRDGGSGAVGGVAQDVLRVGGSGTESHGPGVGESFSREALYSSGCGEGGASEASPGSGEKVVPGGEDDRGERSSFGIRSS